MENNPNLSKYNSMCRIRDLGLPTVKFKGYYYSDINVLLGSSRARIEKRKEFEGHVADLLATNGIFGIRTESVTFNPVGHFPHGFPIRSLKEATNFIENTHTQKYNRGANYGELFYIVNEGIPVERMVFNAVVTLDFAFGRWKLDGNINYVDTLCLRDAMKVSKNLIDVSTLCNNDVAYLRRALLDAGLIDGEYAEVSRFKDPYRTIFWEIRSGHRKRLFSYEDTIVGMYGIT